jgi:hypothetical protein
MAQTAVELRTHGQSVHDNPVPKLTLRLVEYGGSSTISMDWTITNPLTRRVFRGTSAQHIVIVSANDLQQRGLLPW